MTLFLTSSPCDDHVPEGVNLPCIFFERNGFVAELQRNVRPGGRFLAIAASPDEHAHNDEMADTFAGCFGYHGMAFSAMEVLDGRNRDDAAWLVAHSDVILLAGGHVPTENAFFSEIGLRALLTDYPGVVMGVSAGSMNAADAVYAQPEEPGEAADPHYRRWLEGLGLTDKNILPHYQMVKDNVIDGQRLFEDVTFGDSYGHAFIVLEDGSYIVEDAGKSTLCGKAYLIRDGVMTPLCEEEQRISL